jgi:hypothetical protein
MKSRLASEIPTFRMPVSENRDGRIDPVYAVLLATKNLARIFYRFEVSWIGATPGDPWCGVRLVLFLNHTSLYEPLFAGWVPNRFLKALATRGVLPVAEKTLRRPLVGKFFDRVAAQVVPVSRERDHSWQHFLASIDANSMAVIAPEGRMKRSNGRDLSGNPMTVRGGVADLLLRIGDGRMLIAYSGGLHHVQAPGQRLPRLFKTLQMKVESLDIAAYNRRISAQNGDFKGNVIRDLQMRRGLYCPEHLPPGRRLPAAPLPG